MKVKCALKRVLFGSALALAFFAAHAGVTVVQTDGPATSWPGSPIVETMANPATATVTQTFTNGEEVFGTFVFGGDTNLSQSFMILTTNYTLQKIDIYAGGGTGTGSGTNVVLNLYDLGLQVSPNPSPYNRVAYPDIIGGNLLGSGSGLAIAYTSQANGILEFDFSGADQVVLQLGHTYVFEVTGVARTTPLNWLCITSTRAYMNGAAYANGYWLNGSNNYTADFSMAVYGNVTSSAPAVPPPKSGAATVNWNDVHQRIDGFGASSAFAGVNFTTTQANQFFSTNTGIGLSLLRNEIVEGGQASSPEINLMKQAQALGARLWSTPWSPQPSFKTPQQADGGNYAGGDATNLAYATQLANYVLTMKNQGLSLYAISIQNEPNQTPTTYPSCGWTAQQMSNFIPVLYNAMTANNVTATKIILPESSSWTGGTSLYTNAMNDTNLAAMVGIIADHNYDGVGNDPATNAPAANPSYGKALWETEVAALTPSGASDSSMQNGVYWAGRIHAFMTVAQANAWHHWWLVSFDTTPNEGLTDITQTALAKRAYVIGQFSRFVRPNYYRIGATINLGAVMVSAYKETNTSKFVIVAINSSTTNSVNETFNLTNFTTATVTPWITSPTLSLAGQSAVAVANGSFTYNLPALSVVTFVGQGNTPPTLAAVANQTNNAGVTLTITNTATDSDLPAQTLTFSLLSAPVGATLNSTSGIFSWRSPISAAGTTNLVQLEVSDSGTPSLSATNSFMVVVNPVAQPAVSSFTVTGGQVTLTVNGPLGPDYTLLTTTNLALPWQELITANSPVTPFIFTDTNTTDAARYYRIQIGP